MARRRVQFLVGVLADLEITLNSLARVNGSGDFLNYQLERVAERTQTLDLAIGLLDDAAPVVLREVRRAIGALTLNDSSVPTASQRQKLLKVAAFAEASARQLARVSGESLEALDQWLLNEAINPVGRPLQPPQLR